MESQTSIRIPIGENNQFVEVFPDELPTDVNDLIDALRAEFAPIKIWRAVAIEYHRQGLQTEFDIVLQEIVTAMADGDVEEFYRGKPEYQESIAEIYNALAADALVKSGEQLNDTLVQEYLKKADPDYATVIKGLFELRSVNIDRADYYFRNLFTQANRQLSSKKPFLYIANVGLGCVQYSKAKYQQAQEHFSAAIRCNPNPHAAVRVALASSLFMLQQFDKCSTAVALALESDPSNVSALVLLSLLDRVHAQKDKVNRKERRAAAYENCLLAAHIDPSCVMALNHMANHYFNTWRLLEKASIISTRKVRFSTPDAVAAIHEGDLLQFDRTFVSSVGTIEKLPSGDSIVVTLKVDIPQDILDKYLESEDNEAIQSADENSFCVCVELKELNQVRYLAGKAYRLSQVNEMRAESMLILARLYHIIGDIKVAMHFYDEALKLSPEMSLAAMLLGQLHLSLQDFANAQRRFEQVLTKYPDDKDSQAYLALVKCLGESREITKMEKLKEVAPGFAWEEDLWLLQGQLRLGNVQEHATALKCLDTALECVQRRGGVPDPSTLSNISVLHHCLGSALSVSLDYAKRALAAVHDTSLTGQASAGGIVGHESKTVKTQFHCAENEVFFKWSEILCEVSISDSTVESNGCYGSVSVTATGSSLHPLFEIEVLDTVMIGDVLFSVETAVLSDTNGNVSFDAKAPIKLPQITADGTPCSYSLRHKCCARNFTDKSVTYCYNYARVLEDMGRSCAASEIYLELINRHPSFVECYLRLGRISCDLGRLDAALNWTRLAVSIDESNTDARICLGDVHTKRQEWDDAKRIYERICKENHHDARGMIAIGNLYFANLNIASKYEKCLVDSYRFYGPVLNEDHQNAFAANGFGMVCAERRWFDASRDIFCKVRDTGMCALVDTYCNLANIYLVQDRHGEAVLSYQAAIKSITHPHTPFHHCTQLPPTRRLAAVYECLSLAHFKHQQHSDAVRYILRTLHLDPTASHSWYNHAYLREEFAIHCLRKQVKGIKDIDLAIGELETAYRLFRYLKEMPSEPSLLYGNGGMEKYDVGKVKAHLDYCQSNVAKAKEFRKRALEDEAIKRAKQQKQQTEQEQKQLEKQREKEAEREAAEAHRRLLQEKAAQRAAQLEALQQSWKDSGGAPSGASKKEKEKGRKRGRDEGKALDDIDFGSDEDDNGVAQDGQIASSAASASGTRDSNFDDLFGSDDDDDAAAADAVVKADGRGEPSAVASASMVTGEDTETVTSDSREGGRLKRTQVGNDEDDGDDVNDIFGDDEEAAGVDTAENVLGGTGTTAPDNAVEDEEEAESAAVEVDRPVKQRRVIDDDDDE